MEKYYSEPLLENELKFDFLCVTLSDYIMKAEELCYDFEGEALNHRQEMLRDLAQEVARQIDELLPEIRNPRILNSASTCINESTIGIVKLMGTQEIWDKINLRLNELGYEPAFMCDDPIPKSLDTYH
ncbi:MAG: hypothetical protein LBV19_08945 [Streptococcaceae bacterium]|nr:hypothetical protein [Streptococcaceae bacterium]